MSASQLALPQEIVKRNLAVMTDSIYKLVTHDKATGSFSFNASFWNPNRKFALPSIRTKNAKEERAAVSESVQGDRKFFTDAVIVRVMKNAKRMQYQSLVSETMHHCSSRFAPEVRMIKSCLESLMEREFLQRDENDSNYILYCA